jgi:Glycosyl hydrolase family 63 C-terminal domain
MVNSERLRRILTKMLDENEFLSPYGIRSISKFHEQHPYVFHVHGQEYRVDYLPAESNTGMFGGNSNWRGPIWMPVNAMIIRALLNFYLYYGDNFKIECPTGSGKLMNLFEVSKEIADRLSRIFFARRTRTATRLWWQREVPERSPLARPHPVPRILPRRQRRWARCKP